MLQLVVYGHLQRPNSSAEINTTEAIEPSQTAFIKGRLLLENLLLALELVNGYHRTSNSNKATVKFDISKAFDTVKWSFITSVLKAMGLPVQFIL